MWYFYVHRKMSSVWLTWLQTTTTNSLLSGSYIAVHKDYSIFSKFTWRSSAGLLSLANINSFHLLQFPSVSQCKVVFNHPFLITQGVCWKKSMDVAFPTILNLFSISQMFYIRIQIILNHLGSILKIQYVCEK